MDLSKVHWLPTACGVAVWAAAIVLIWIRSRAPTSAQRENDFARWKASNGEPHATFGDFLASEQAPRIYLGRGAVCVVVSAVALLVLLDALHRWGVFA